MKQIKYTPKIASARRRWRSYKYQDKKCNLSFDQWFSISQQNCFYCGIAPAQQYNCFLKRRDASQKAKDNGTFTYNGLDRIDNSQFHTINNVVPCCWTCNRAKNYRSINDFYKYINSLNIKSNQYNDKLLILPSSYLLVSVKIAYRYYIKNYKKMEIDLRVFYNTSQLPCHYCGIERSNYCNVYLKDKKASQKAKDGAHFYYNGIDRLDNSKVHSKDNIVPCCRSCNFAKSNLTLEKFYNWIRRIKEYQTTKAQH